MLGLAYEGRRWEIIRLADPGYSGTLTCVRSVRVAVLSESLAKGSGPSGPEVPFAAVTKRRDSFCRWWTRTHTMIFYKWGNVNDDLIYLKILFAKIMIFLSIVKTARLALVLLATAGVCQPLSWH